MEKNKHFLSGTAQAIPNDSGYSRWCFCARRVDMLLPHLQFRGFFISVSENSVPPTSHFNRTNMERIHWISGYIQFFLYQRLVDLARRRPI